MTLFKLQYLMPAPPDHTQPWVLGWTVSVAADDIDQALALASAPVVWRQAGTAENILVAMERVLITEPPSGFRVS